MKEKLDLYLKENLGKKDINIFFSFKKKKDSFSIENLKEECESNIENNQYLSKENYLGAFNCEKTTSFNNNRNIKSNNNIHDYIEKHANYNKFQTLLFELIDRKKLKDNEVYNKVHIDRRLFSKIRSDSNYHPSKETILLLGFSLELNENEIDKLLESASYSLPKNNNYDLIIRFCFINKIYKLTEINGLLEEYHCKLFNY